MRTTLDIPEELMAEVMEELKFKSKTDAVIFSLRETLRRSRLEGLKGLAGKMEIKFDPKMQRKRDAKTKRSA